MSRAARCAVFGVAMTLLALFGPWRWPGWPLETMLGFVLDFVLARYTPSVLPTLVHALMTVALLLINSILWAAAAWIALKLRDVVRAR